MRHILLCAVMALGLTTLACGDSSPVGPTLPAYTSPVVTQPSPAPLPAPVLPVRGPQFSQPFWDAFVHNGFEQPSALQPLRRLASAPMLYLKIVDEGGVQIDPVTLSTVENAMREVAPIWGGGLFGLRGVQRGTGTMAGVSGWLTVRFLAANVGTLCGRANIGLDGGVIELNYQNRGTSCACLGGSNVSPRTARHELGHAFGYYHTDSTDDLMKSVVAACDGLPSSRESYHATVAYQTPVGSMTFRGSTHGAWIDD